jgi:uncharacterized protein YhbP (UPF0306 family)
MNKIDPEITVFLSSHFVLSLATSKNNKPYSANCYYLFNEDNHELIFSSDIKTKHAQYFMLNKHVSATISVPSSDIEKIQGVQIVGEIEPIIDSDKAFYNQLYIDHFPIAKDIKLSLWSLKLSFIKMTDNSISFGHKVFWEK